MPTTLENRRSYLVATLKALTPHMRRRLQGLKDDAEKLRERPDLLWYLLLQSAATHGNSRGWAGLCGNPDVLRSVSYSVLAPLRGAARVAGLTDALQNAGVRWSKRKAAQLAANVARIGEMGGVEKATKQMWNLPNPAEKLRFMQMFEGIGEKYGRNVWMDLYDSAFRNTVAIDNRLKNIAEELGFQGKKYEQYELFYCQMARDAGLEPWALDRLLYTFTDYFLDAIKLSSDTVYPLLEEEGGIGGN